MATITAVSPFAPAAFPDLPPVAGVRYASLEAGLRYRQRLDLTLIEFAPGTTVAGVFTTSTTAGHPVLWGRKILPHGRARAVLVNAGNANVFRGEEGDQAVATEARAVAEALGCGLDEIYIASTGVIGERLPVEKITLRVGDLVAGLDENGAEAAARAIMTTDTFAKGASRVTAIDGVVVTLNGIAKGSGMIAPDMATMLSFIATDAAIPAPILQHLLNRAVERSFNAITVDSDTSTSDTVLAFATAQAAHGPVHDPSDPRLIGFSAALGDLCLDLAHQVVRDGEGAQKFIEIAVDGAVDDTSARRIGLAIANSPLVKTAIAGADANWGRVIMAIGKAREPVAAFDIEVAFGGIKVAEKGGAVPAFDEDAVSVHLAGREIRLDVRVGRGAGKAVVWTCDLTHAYIDINADYRS